MTELVIQHIVLPNGKELLFITGRGQVIGQQVYQRSGNCPWEPFDQRILQHSPIPRKSIVEQRVF